MSERDALERRGSPPLLVIDPDGIPDVLRHLAAGDASGTVRRVRTVADALAVLEESPIGCLLVSVPALDEAELSRLRERTDAPLIALVPNTAAPRALAAGATDVLDPSAPGPVVRARVRQVLAADDRDARRPFERTVLEVGPVAWMTVDDESTITFATPSIEPLLGRTPTDVLGRSVDDLVHPTDASTVRSLLADARGGDAAWTDASTVRVRHADDAWRRRTVTAVADVPNGRADATGTGIVFAPAADPPSSDLETWVNGLDRPAAAIDEAGAIRIVADGLAAVVDDAPAVGQPLWSIFPAEARDTVRDHLERCLEERRPVTFETPPSTAHEREPTSGTVEWLVAPTESGAMMVATDWTLDEEADAALEDESALAASDLESVADALGIGLVGFDVESGRITDVTAAARAIVRGERDGEVSAASATDETPDSSRTNLVGQHLETVLDARTQARLERRLHASTTRRTDPFECTVETPSTTFVTAGDVVRVGSDRALLCLYPASLAGDRSTHSVFGRVAAALDRRQPPSQLGTLLVDAILEVTPASAAGCYLRDGDQLVPVGAAPGDAQPPISFPRLELAGASALDPRRLSGPAAGAVSSGAFDRLLDEAGLYTEIVFVVPIGDRGLLVATGLGLRTLEAADVETAAWLAEQADRTLEAAELHRRLETRRRRTEQLETALNRRGDVDALFPAVESAVATDGADSIDDALASALVDRDWVEGVWIGAVDPGAVATTERARAGDPVVPFAGAVGSATTEANALSTAIDDATVTAVSTVDLDAERGGGGTIDSDRLSETESGTRGCVYLGIGFDGRRDGVVSIATTGEPDAETLESLESLRTTVSLAYALEECRDLLASDDRLVLEVTVATADGPRADAAAEPASVTPSTRDPLVAFADRLARRLEVLTVTDAEDGATAVLWIRDIESVSDGRSPAADFDAAAIRSAAEPIDELELVEWTGDRDGVQVRATVSDENVASVVATHGGRLREIDATDRRPRLTVELAPGTSVRTVLDRLERWDESVALRSKRLGGADRSAGTFGERVREHLTDRQLETLRVSYRAGYFAWPRERTGSEVAALLDVSQPTFARHLRIAERKLSELLFDEGWA